MIDIIRAFLALLAFFAGGFLAGYWYRGHHVAALGTVEPSPWQDYHSEEHP